MDLITWFTELVIKRLRFLTTLKTLDDIEFRTSTTHLTHTLIEIIFTVLTLIGVLIKEDFLPPSGVDPPLL